MHCAWRDTVIDKQKCRDTQKDKTTKKECVEQKCPFLIYKSDSLKNALRPKSYFQCIRRARYFRNPGDEELTNKIYEIAARERRSVTAQILYMLDYAFKHLYEGEDGS